MARNVSDRSFKNILPTALRDTKQHFRHNRTDQVQWQGYFPLKQGLSTVIEVMTGLPDGAMYYATDLTHGRILIAGTWTTFA